MRRQVEETGRAALGWGGLRGRRGGPWDVGGWAAVRSLALAFAVVCAACTDSSGPDTELTITPDSATLLPGGSVQLTAVGAPGSVTWTSSDGSVAQVVEVTGFVTAVSRGSATITARSGNRSATALIRVVLPPIIELSEPLVELAVLEGEGDPPARDVAVTNGGDLALEGLTLGAVAYGEGQPAGWLTPSLSGPVAPATLTLQASVAGLVRGTYTATLPVVAPEASNTPQSLAITLAVQHPPRIELSTDRVQLSAIPDTMTSPRTVEVTNGGDLPLTGLGVAVAYEAGQPAGWLDAELSGSEAPATVSLVASSEGLAVGQYTATVTVSSTVAGVDPASFEVEFTVNPGPAIDLVPEAVTFDAVQGGDDPPPQTVAVENAGGGTLHSLALGTVEYAAGQPEGWLSVSLADGTAPTTITLEVASSELAAGTYTATVPVTSPAASNSPRDLAVTLRVGPPPSIALSPTSLTFSAGRLRGNPTPQVVQVTNSGGGVLSGLSVEVQYTGGGQAGWLGTAQLASTTAPTTLTLQPVTGSLPVGEYTATVSVSSSLPGVATRSVSVTFRVVLSYEVDVFGAGIFSTNYGAGTETPCTSGGCHAQGSNVPRFYSATLGYSDLVDGGRVVPGNPNVGVLICKITAGANCGSAMRLPEAQIQIIENWIEQGAVF